MKSEDPSVADLEDIYQFPKKILEEVAIIPSKLLCNKIAGFSTNLMKHIQKGRPDFVLCSTQSPPKPLYQILVIFMGNSMILLSFFELEGSSCVQLLVGLKVCYPQRITILRGNHDGRQGGSNSVPAF